MDVLEILGSINKISIFFFILTLGVLGYEFYLFQKEKQKKEKVKIPTFDPTKVTQPQHYSTVQIPSEKPKTLKKHVNLSVVIGIATVVIFGIVLFIIFRNVTTEEELPPPVNTRAVTNPTLASTPTPTEKIQQAVTSPSPTEVILAQNPTTTLTQTPSSSIGGQLTTTTPSATISATVAPTSTATPTVKSSTSSSELLQVGFAQPQLFIFLLGALTVLVSILY